MAPRFALYVMTTARVSVSRSRTRADPVLVLFALLRVVTSAARLMPSLPVVKLRSPQRRASAPRIGACRCGRWCATAEQLVVELVAVPGQKA